MIAHAIRVSYPDTKRADAIGGAVLVLRIDDDCEREGLAPVFTPEHVERTSRGECMCEDCRAFEELEGAEP